MLTCEAVIAEALFPLRRGGIDPDGLLTLISRGLVMPGFSLVTEIGAISKHMKVLRDNGLVTTNRAGLNSIPAGRLVSAEEGTVDYGNCLLRLRRDG